MSSSVETWAFCGVHPDAPNASRAVQALAVNAGIDSTCGPAMPPDWSTYTPAQPGGRYVDFGTYDRLTALNASVGMKTVVYDARLWSTDAGERQAAIDFWAPSTDWIRAFDLGDEFDPGGPDWAVLIARWRIMTDIIQPATGVGPFTNHLPYAEVLSKALVDMPESRTHLSFDCYDEPTALALTREFDPQVDHLMVAVNALKHGQFTPTSTGIVRHMRNLRAAGADSFLIFGGANPYNSDLSPDPAFGNRSLITGDGEPTSWANAVLRGAES
ncbi:MAG: hypothetical protein ACXVLX_07425 [Ilumatobacteraceae bacterium]